MTKLALALAALLLAPGALALGDVVYVDASAPGPAHDGTSWATAFDDLQAALAAAGTGDEIWVAAGTYRPTSGSDRTASFILKNGVGIYGGFAGDETLRSQRDPAAHETTLSGEIGLSGVADNSDHVVRSPDATVTASAVLDGFTIIGGNATGAPPDNRGGGILVLDGSPTLARLVVTGNHADDRGGGVRIDAGNPSFDACRLQSNTSSVGGGGLSSGSGATISVRNSIFRGNSTGPARGGGIDANHVAAADCLIVSNSPNGVYIAQDGASFVNCTFAVNSAYAVFFNGGPNNSIANSILYGDSIGEISLGFSAGVGVSFSDVEGGGFAGAGNVDLPPLFENSASGNYRPAALSPAVDAGSNAAATGAALTTDQSGFPRFFDDPAAADTGTGTAPIVDMGAYERVPLTVSTPTTGGSCTERTFSVTASGQPPLTFQWRKEGSNLSDGGAISGSKTDTLTIENPTSDDSGSYDVVVTDGLGQQKSSGAVGVTFNPFPNLPLLSSPKSIPVGATGVLATASSNPGASYEWTVSPGSIGSGQGTGQITFSAAAPGTTMTVSVLMTSAGGCATAELSNKVQVDFADAPPSHLFHDAIVSVALAGITTGCGGGKYCPNDPVTRDAMAVFILRGEHGGDYSPPPAQGDVFSDVTPSTFLAKWMEQFGREGISTGCGGGAPPPYCPSQAVTRDGMAVFLLRGKHGSAFNPSAATGAVFCDVSTSTFLAKWMEELKSENITGGCGAGMCGKPNFCVTNTVTRGEMAAFIRKTFGLP